MRCPVHSSFSGTQSNLTTFELHLTEIRGRNPSSSLTTMSDVEALASLTLDTAEDEALIFPFLRLPQEVPLGIISMAHEDYVAREEHTR